MKSNDLNHFLLSDIPDSFILNKDTLEEINKQRFQLLTTQSIPDDTYSAVAQPAQSVELITAFLFYMCIKELI
ncbi:MAG: hypothetical protein K0R15_172 [Clostridiales bacterium]|jgi:hypothetical protein|nr:hypothetical protein [Clostridiales bacterium]